MTGGQGIHVRAATTADIDALVAFNAAMAMETEAKELDPDVLRRGVGTVLREPARGFYLVAECGGVVAGCLMVTFEWSDWRNGDWWWLQSVYVAADFRRSGVFRALYAEVEHRASRSTGVIGIRLYVERDNLSAQRTYQAFGLREEHYRLFGKPLRVDVPGGAT